MQETLPDRGSHPMRPRAPGTSQFGVPTKEGPRATIWPGCSCPVQPSPSPAGTSLRVREIPFPVVFPAKSSTLWVGILSFLLTFVSSGLRTVPGTQGRKHARTCTPGLQPGAPSWGLSSSWPGGGGGRLGMGTSQTLPVSVLMGIGEGKTGTPRSRGPEGI